MKLKKVLVIHLEPKNKQEEKTLRTVFRILRENEINYSNYERNFVYTVPEKSFDLIIVVGGDGTFLRTSHHITKTPMIGINLNPKQKEGFLMQCNSKNFATRLKQIQNNKFKIIKLTRLEAKINKKGIPFALNDIFIGHRLPFKTSRFDLYINKKKEFQKCSGMVIGTAAGSNAWLGSAGGIIEPLASKKFQFLVREPYEGKLHKHKFKKGLLKPKDIIKIKILDDDYVIAIDSLVDYALQKGDVVTIKTAKNSLNYIIF